MLAALRPSQVLPATGAGFRRSLAALVAVGLLPMLLFAGALVWLFVQQQRAAAQSELMATARALLVAVDRELSAHMRILETLAGSDALDRGDLAAFRAEAERAAAGGGLFSLALIDPVRKIQLINTAAPAGSPGGSNVPVLFALDALARVVSERRGIVSGVLAGGTFVTSPFVLLRVPVVRDGGVPFVLSGTMNTASLSGLFAEQSFRPAWTGTVIDPALHIAGRSRHADRFLAQMVTPSLAEHIRAASQGMFLATNKEGEPVYTVFSRSPATGWTVAIGIPAAEIDGPLWRSVAGVVAAGLVVLVVGATLASALGRAIATRREAAERLAAAREAMLAAARDHAEAADRTKTAFLANVSHELRTPLNAVIGFADAILSEVYGPLENARYLGYVADIHASGRHLLGVINDLLDLSKIDAGKMPLAEETVDPARLIAEVHRLLEPRAAAAGIQLAAVADGVPPVKADSLRLRQILLNIAGNAVKFTPAGGRVVLSARLNDDGELALAVADTGIGMRPDEVATALTPFGQVDRTRRRQEQGTGLGLPLAKALAELHGGHLSVESSENRGTTVTVTLPPTRVLAASAG